MLSAGVRHPWWLSVVLHALPGLAFVAGHRLLAPLLLQTGYGVPFTALVVVPALVAAVQLAVLWYAAPVQDGRRSLRSLISLQAPLAKKVYGLWVPLLVLYGLGLRWFVHYDPWLNSFSSTPAAMSLGTLEPGMMLAVFSFGLTFFGVLAPVVEELYYRGFLLPRMPGQGLWIPLLHAAVYALVFSEMPWAVMRFAAILPLVLVVWRQRSVYPAMMAQVVLRVTILMYLLSI